VVCSQNKRAVRNTSEEGRSHETIDRHYRV
jgi:hypothetical protein